MLIVELDGPIHEQRKEYDKSRDDILKSMGYNVLRINNDELDNIDGVLDKIKAQFKNPSSPSLSAGRGSGGV
jgi:very-short-patch-repair endonuclease